MVVKWVVLSTCLPIDLTVAHMCKVAVVKGTTLNTIIISTNDFAIGSEIGKGGTTSN